MALMLEQFIRFGTDAAGLERFFRLIQSLLQVTIFYPTILKLLVSALQLWQAPHASPAISSASVAPILGVLRTRFALGRRFFRLFRFAESFHSAHRLWGTLSSPTSTSRTETYLGVLGRTFNGMYLLLETAHFPDALGVEGMSLWGEYAPALAVEAQRFWFLSLVCGALAGTVRLVELWAYAPVPETGSTYGGGEGVEQDEAEGITALEKEGMRGGNASRQQRQKETKRRKDQRLIHQQERAGRSRKIVRRLVADVLDLAIPGSIVGYINLDDGPVGLAMLVTTILTGLEVWERCGQEVDVMSR